MNHSQPVSHPPAPHRSDHTAVPTAHTPLRLRTAGYVAWNALHEPSGVQHAGRVLAVFARSLYVRWTGKPDGEPVLSCFGAPALGTGPLNALCDGPWPTDRVDVGDPVLRTGDTLRIGTVVRISLAEVEPWCPPRLDTPIAPALLQAGLTALDDACTHALPARGLARTLLGRPPLPSTPMERVPLDAAMAAAGALSNWLRTDQGAAPAPPPPDALALLGMGTGLTPAGDDFLGGWLIALRQLAGSGPAHRAADALAAALHPQLAERTGTISAAHLRCAMAGQGAAALHAVLVALAQGGAALVAPLACLDRIGHTSGWDALAGAVCAARALAAADDTNGDRP